MIEDTIGKIEAKIEGVDTIQESRRRELLQLPHLRPIDWFEKRFHRWF